MADPAASGYVTNSAQRRLAEELTRFVHGEAGLQQALRATEGLKPGAATTLDAAALEALAGDVPSVTLPKAEVVGALVCDVMVRARALPPRRPRPAPIALLLCSSARGAEPPWRRCRGRMFSQAAAALQPSKSAARRLIQGGGVYLNNQKAR